MQYNTVGGIENKTQTHDRKSRGQNDWVKQGKTTYELAYAYGTEQPNAPVHIGDQTYSYDAKPSRPLATRQDGPTTRAGKEGASYETRKTGSVPSTTTAPASTILMMPVVSGC